MVAATHLRTSVVRTPQSSIFSESDAALGVSINSKELTPPAGLVGLDILMTNWTPIDCGQILKDLGVGGKKVVKMQEAQATPEKTSWIFFPPSFEFGGTRGRGGG